MIVHSLVFTCLDAGDGDVTETERDATPPLDADVTAGCPPGILQAGPLLPLTTAALGSGTEEFMARAPGQWGLVWRQGEEAHTCLITMKAGKKQKTKKTDN